MLCTMTQRVIFPPEATRRQEARGMAEAQGSVFDRFNDALKNLDDQLQELRDRFDDQRKRFEDQVTRQREKLEAQLKDTALYKRTERVRKDVEDQVERGRAQIYDAFGVASKSEIDKINRKLTTISKKLNELAKEQHRVEL